jgi:hypothetical protein
VLRTLVLDPWWETGGRALALSVFGFFLMVVLIATAVVSPSDGWPFFTAAGLACGTLGVAAGRMWWKRFNARVKWHQQQRH